MIEMHAIASGRVQGVFFRATTKELALKLCLKGTVRNLPDGTVEIYAQGPKTSLEQLLQQLKDSSGLGSVDHFQTTFYPQNGHFEDFRIVY